MIDAVKVVIPTILTFLIGISITPFFTNFFYKHKMWKKSPRINNADGVSDDFAKNHNTNEEISTPRIGGVIIWVSVLLCVIVIYFLSVFFPNDLTEKLNFFSRSQTYVPIGTLIFASLIGLADDLLQIFGKGNYARDPLIYRKIKVVLICLIGLVVGYWFYDKLDFTGIHVPFGGVLSLGAWFIPVFIFVMFSIFSSSVIDGMDGLAGGIMAILFMAYSFIAYSNNMVDIATLCAVISGATLAFLWFNIPPARFYLGETGMLGLTVTLSVIVFLTDTVLIFPIIALPLTATSASVVIQVLGYKFFNKKRVFRVAPLHHHFEAIGWPRTKVVMRYWVVSLICAISGIILAVIS